MNGTVSSCPKQFTTRSAVILHAGWLDQSCLHVQYSLLLPPRRSRVRVSVPVWGVTLSRPPNYHRLGEPLPHQLANSTHAHPSPINLYYTNHAISADHVVLIPVSRGYPAVKGRLRTRYSPVRRCPRSEDRFSLDLHVLSLPLAFILSQDQTLHCKVLNIPYRSKGLY